MTDEVLNLLDKLCPSTACPCQASTVSSASTERKASALESFKALLESRPPIVDAPVRAVYDWFINWTKEITAGTEFTGQTGVSIPVRYDAFDDRPKGCPASHLPSLPARMRKGRKAGEPFHEGSSNVCSVEQPPIQLPDWKIKQCLNWLSENGYLVKELSIGRSGRVQDTYYYLMPGSQDDKWLLEWLKEGYVFGQTMKVDA